MNSSRITKVKDWRELGTKLFGDDFKKFKFKCPNCGNVAAVEDFKQFKDQGATPNTAAQHCIGRFTGGRKGPNKCDWAAFGLFQGPNFVEHEDGSKDPVFRFDGEPE